MSQSIYQAGERFYWLLPGRYPDSRYHYWRLWQRIVPRSCLWMRWWGKKGAAFWLDTSGFYEVRISLKDAAWTYWKEHKK